MAPPRKRSIENEDLPPNVYYRTAGGTKYYYYEYPDTFEREELGSDRYGAIKTGKALNSALGHMSRRPKQSVPTIGSVIAEWMPKRIERLKSDSAKKSARNGLEQIRRQFGKRGLREVGTPKISDFLETIPLTYRSKRRNEFIRLFDYAISRGYLPHNYGNPARVTEYQGEPPAQRMRLGYADFQAIYQEAPDWLQILMDTMLHTTLRPGDALRLKLDQFYDGYLHTQVRKSLKYLRIELDVNEQLIIKRARQTGIASPFVIHRMPIRKGKKRLAAERSHPTQVMLDQASREFSKIRDRLKICSHVETKKRPSLVEIRSLGLWLYGEMNDRDQLETQALAAHTSEEMTEYYQDDRRVNFVTVRAGLKIA